MKQLFVNGNATTLFFSKDSSFDDIFEWVQEQVYWFDSKNIFKLNEQHSCIVNNSIDGMCISGDEDLKQITVKDITPIL